MEITFEEFMIKYRESGIVDGIVNCEYCKDVKFVVKKKETEGGYNYVNCPVCNGNT